MNKYARDVTGSPIKMLLVRMTLPSIVGMLGLTIFNIADTYFIGKLGTVELAAISFTFPLVLFFGSLSLGLGIGIMALFSRAVGTRNIREEKRLATAGLMLAMVLSSLIAIVGFFTIRPVFHLLGAGEDLMPHILAYMRVWYLGSVFLVFPMIGDHILRGLGDTKTPSLVMLACAVSNILLDPLLIFGLGPFPAMGVMGAAVATVFSRMIGTGVTLWIQIHREHLISFRGLTLRDLLAEWKAILYLGLPNSVVKMILPLAIGIFTAILARYGHETVAAYGVATRIEGFLLSAVHALGITAAVFVGQNLGAQRPPRVRQGVYWLNVYSVLYGLAVYALVALTGKYLGAFFSDSSQVQNKVRMYLLIVPVGYGFFAMAQIASSILNVLRKPLYAAAISIIQVFAVSVPMALLLAPLWQAEGVFVAISLSHVAAGILALGLMRNRLNPALKAMNQTTPPHQYPAP